MTTEELINKPLDLETMKKVYDRLNKEVDKMEKKKYDIYYYAPNNTILEIRQCSHLSEWQAAHEAELYAAWAEYHYGCKVKFRIRTIKDI